MGEPLLVLSIANAVSLVGVCFYAGRKVQELSDLRKHVEQLEKQKTEVVLSTVQIKLGSVETQIQQLNDKFVHFVDYLVSGDKKILRHFQFIGGENLADKRS